MALGYEEIVKLLISFEPTNDIEFLCKNYWLIIFFINEYFYFC